MEGKVTILGHQILQNHLPSLEGLQYLLVEILISQIDFDHQLQYLDSLARAEGCQLLHIYEGK